MINNSSQAIFKIFFINLLICAFTGVIFSSSKAQNGTYMAIKKVFNTNYRLLKKVALRYKIGLLSTF